MSEMTIKVKEVVRYGGHSLSANGSVNFTLKASYSDFIKGLSLKIIITANKSPK